MCSLKVHGHHSCLIKGTRHVWGFVQIPTEMFSQLISLRHGGLASAVTTELDMVRSPTENHLPSYKAEDKHVTLQRIQASKQAITLIVQQAMSLRSCSENSVGEFKIYKFKSQQVLYFPYAEMLYAGAPFSNIPGPLPE